MSEMYYVSLNGCSETEYRDYDESLEAYFAGRPVRQQFQIGGVRILVAADNGDVATWRLKKAD